jgi:hypothetical protein
MVLSTSKNGLVAGLKKALKVILWHIASNALVVVGAYLASIRPDTSDIEKYALIVSMLAVSNAVLAFAGKWLKTVAPAEVESLAVHTGLA